MTTLSNAGDVISTDLLIIGGGISGVIAAIEAKEQPVDVLLVEKATVGWAGQTPFVEGHLGLITPDDDIERFIKWVIQEGEYLNNQEWLFSMVRDWYRNIKRIADWGAPITMAAQGQKDTIRRGLIGRAAFPPTKMMVSLRRIARSKGVKILNKVQVVDLLKRDGRIVGAVGFNVIDGHFHVFRSKAVIVSSSSCDFKVQRLFVTSCGEGIAMAYRAGAEMRNAEFSNLYLPALKDYDTFNRGVWSNFYFNALGENISEKYRPDGKERWLPLAKGMVKEVEDGRGPIYIDLTKVPAKVKEEGVPAKMSPFGRSRFLYVLNKVGIDPFSVKLEVVLRLQGKVSPIKVDTDCKATVPGLWATGDACAMGAGCTGALLGQGFSLSWPLAFSMCSGLRSGNSASNFAHQASFGELDAEEVKQLKEETFASFQRHRGLLPADAIYEIQEVVYPIKYNFLRSKDRLEEGLAKIRELQDKLPELWARDTHELVQCHEAKSLALCAEMVFRSALMRTESRGCHIRQDYPGRDDQNWLKWIVIKRVGENMSLSTEPVPIETYKFKPPRDMVLLEAVGKSSENSAF